MDYVDNAPSHKYVMYGTVYCSKHIFYCGEKSKMALPFESEQSRVLLTCSCSALSQIARLYFCRHCIQLRCPLCVSHEVIPLQRERRPKMYN